MEHQNIPKNFPYYLFSQEKSLSEEIRLYMRMFNLFISQQRALYYADKVQQIWDEGGDIWEYLRNLPDEHKLIDLRSQRPNKKQQSKLLAFRRKYIKLTGKDITIEEILPIYEKYQKNKEQKKSKRHDDLNKVQTRKQKTKETIPLVEAIQKESPNEKIALISILTKEIKRYDVISKAASEFDCLTQAFYGSYKRKYLIDGEWLAKIFK